MQFIIRLFTTRSLPPALLGMLLYWLALPPLRLWPLVVSAPVVWCLLIRLPSLPGKRPYLALWFSAFLFWLATTWWVCCPHPALILGWFAMSFYLSLYLPLFVAACRIAIFEYRVKPMVVVPVVWCGVEYMRKHIFGGFSFAALEHSVYDRPEWIQIADFGGESLVGMLIVFCGCALACLVPIRDEAGKQSPRLGFFTPRPQPGSTGRSWAFEPLVYALIFVAGTLAYGKYRLDQTATAKEGMPQRRIAVLQGDSKVTLSMTQEDLLKGSEDHIALSRAAAEEEPDLIIWPETVFYYSLVEFRDGFVPEDWRDLPEEEAEERCKAELVRHRGRILDIVARRIGRPVLLGMNTFVFTPEGGDNDFIRLNTALLVDPRGGMLAKYDKVHLVMFGEYIPFGNWIPKSVPFRTLCAEAGRGPGPVAMPIRVFPKSTVADTPPVTHAVHPSGECLDPNCPHNPGTENGQSSNARPSNAQQSNAQAPQDSAQAASSVSNEPVGPTVSRAKPPSPFASPASRKEPSSQFVALPNICFESSVPHFIRRQIATLRRENVEPSMLVNLSNDGWFLKTSENELHLATYIFRGVENRKLSVSATNGGIAVIADSDGRILRRGQAGRLEYLVADLAADSRTSIYSNWGDTYAVGCLFATLFIALSALFMRSPDRLTGQNGNSTEEPRKNATESPTTEPGKTPS